MTSKILAAFLFVFIIGFVTALPTCLDTNQQDVSNMPCLGFTVSVNCSGNVTAYNATNPADNFTFETFVFVDSIYNFTLNLSNGEYELVDCENNTATIFVGLVEQGFGINLFGVIFPSMILSLVTLFISGRMFKRFRDDDDEQVEHLEKEDDSESFVPRSRLMPIIFMLFAFIPMIFMIGFTSTHLNEYLAGSNITTFYASFYIMFSLVFVFVFLISIIVWLSSFIKLRRVMKGLDDID